MLNILELGICHPNFLVFLLDLETSGLLLTDPQEGVFHAEVGRYNLNYYDAQRVCEIHGATLATFDQLHYAWSAGLERCRYVNHFILVVVVLFLFIFQFSSASRFFFLVYISCLLISRIELKYCLIINSYLTGLFNIYI